MKKKLPLKDTKMHENSAVDHIEKYKDEVKEKYGHSDAYKQSQERTKNWEKADYGRVAKEGEEITQAIADARAQGYDEKSPEVQRLIKKHHSYISQFYDCSLEMYRGLGRLYIEDSRFTAYYEKFAKGLAQFMHQSIEIFAAAQ